MKRKIKIWYYSLIVMSVLCLFTSSCKKAIVGCTDSKAINFNSEASEDNGTCTYEPQGPIDPSFENYGSWLNDVYDDHYFSFVTYPTGTGFMPTKGVYFLKMGSVWINGDVTYNRIEQVYQDNVSLKYSKKMIIDYSLQGHGVAKILFTSNGTVTLWTSNINDSAVEKANETITLPSLPEKGRLIIQFSTMSVSTSFLIDNIRVE